MSIMLNANVVAGRGEESYVVTVLTMEAVGNSGGVQIELVLSDGKGQRNRWQRDNHWLDIVLVCIYCLSPFPSCQFVTE